MTIAGAEILQVVASDTMKEVGLAIGAKYEISLCMVWSVYAAQVEVTEGKVGCCDMVSYAHGSSWRETCSGGTGGAGCTYGQKERYENKHAHAGECDR